jgi:glycosyltransferase involved in cell wall biosynthesis
MRFGINAQRLAGQRLGIGRYIEYLLRYCDRQIAPDDEIHVYVEQPFDPASLGLSEKCRVHHLTLNGRRIRGKAWENLLLSSRAREVDVLLGPSYTLPLFYRGRTVVAIHSVNEVQAGAHTGWYQLTYEPLYRASTRRARAVIAPSQSVKEDLVKRYRLSEDKVKVVPLGADTAFAPVDDPEWKQATRVRHIGSDSPYIVWVGKLSRRRNIPLLIEAFALLKKRARVPHKLLLMGPNHLKLPLGEIAERFGVGGEVIQTDGDFADHRELVAVYNAADLFVSASLYEGFSMPLVEAMACGLPVVVSNRAALAEIAGGYGCLVDEITAPSFASALGQVLTDSVLRAELCRKSLARSADYRWHGFARQMLEILRQAGQQ